MQEALGPSLDECPGSCQAWPSSRNPRTGFSGGSRLSLVTLWLFHSPKPLASTCVPCCLPSRMNEAHTEIGKNLERQSGKQVPPNWHLKGSLCVPPGCPESLRQSVSGSATPPPLCCPCSRGVGIGPECPTLTQGPEQVDYTWRASTVSIAHHWDDPQSS